MRNTYKKGILTFLAYKTEDNRWIAACRELGVLVEQVKKEDAVRKMLEQTQFTLTVIKENRLSEDLLNKDIPQEILVEFQEVVQRSNKSKEWSNWSKWDKSVEEIKNADLALA